jgi:hypothetical protein
MKMQKVKSSSVAAYGYDEATRTLAVRFLNGGVYHYADVPPETATGLGSAKSIGSYLHAHIRGKFGHRKQ